MYTVFEQRIVNRGRPDADISYGMVFKTRDERVALQTSKDMAISAVPQYSDMPVVVEVVELDNPLIDRDAVDSRKYPAVVVGAVHIKSGFTPFHSYFIEYTEDEGERPIDIKQRYPADTAVVSKRTERQSWSKRQPWSRNTTVDDRTDFSYFSRYKDDD